MTLPAFDPDRSDRRDQWAHECARQREKTAAVQNWVARKQATAVEMRLRAVAIRLFARTMRGESAGSPPAAPSPSGTPLDRLLRQAVVTEQAKGILAARLHCSADQALTLLQEYSRRMNEPVHLFAREIVDDKNRL
ncbi:ANTAR domain-containing protein [Streptomyces sp. NPDC051214]|uniref:ANTAR domain-containing protein n=1 Tax=Streptomyces sp. NPDC051214 TaxID=3155282 RepID=UPI0034259C66